MLLDDLIEEFNENCTFPIHDLFAQSPHSQHNAAFTYNLDDINFSDQLGIPWEKSKDQLFASSTTYIGFLWNLQAWTVSLAPKKTKKYLSMINDWLHRPAHVLKDVESLHGKLLHTCAVIPHGHAITII